MSLRLRIRRRGRLSDTCRSHTSWADQSRKLSFRSSWPPAGKPCCMVTYVHMWSLYLSTYPYIVIRLIMTIYYNIVRITMYSFLCAYTKYSTHWYHCISYQQSGNKTTCMLNDVRRLLMISRRVTVGVSLQRIPVFFLCSVCCFFLGALQEVLQTHGVCYVLPPKTSVIESLQY